MNFGTPSGEGPWQVGALHKTHNKWIVDHQRTMQDAMVNIARSAIHFAQTQKKIKNRTRALKAGWKMGISRNPDKIKIRLINRVPHALYQELGTGIYGKFGRPIVPKRAKFLHWVTPGGTHMFRRSVKGVPAKFIGREATFEAWGFGKARLLREQQRLASRF